MNYFTDLNFIGGFFATLVFAFIILFQIIKALGSAASLRMKKNVN